MRVSWRTKRIFSCLLIAGGASLVFLGAREIFQSRAGQQEAQREFETPPADTRPAYQPPELGGALARLTIPRLSTDLYVVEGDGPHELRRGPGHARGSAMPGSSGNCIIAGHRDTHFRPLKDIRKGDEITLQTRQGQFLYRVNSTAVISPANLAPLRPTRDAELNLITCYPFYFVGSAPKRFVVNAQLIGRPNPVVNAQYQPQYRADNQRTRAVAKAKFVTKVVTKPRPTAPRTTPKRRLPSSESTRDRYTPGIAASLPLRQGRQAH